MGFEQWGDDLMSKPQASGAQTPTRNSQMASALRGGSDYGRAVAFANSSAGRAAGALLPGGNLVRAAMNAAQGYNAGGLGGGLVSGAASLLPGAIGRGLGNLAGNIYYGGRMDYGTYRAIQDAANRGGFAVNAQGLTIDPRTGQPFTRYAPPMNSIPQTTQTSITAPTLTDAPTVTAATPYESITMSSLLRGVGGGGGATLRSGGATARSGATGAGAVSGGWGGTGGRTGAGSGSMAGPGRGVGTAALGQALTALGGGYQARLALPMHQ